MTTSAAGAFRAGLLCFQATTFRVLCHAHRRIAGTSSRRVTYPDIGGIKPGDTRFALKYFSSVLHADTQKSAAIRLGGR
jgi:hypothetical protein